MCVATYYLMTAGPRELLGWSSGTRGVNLYL